MVGRSTDTRSCRCCWYVLLNNFSSSFFFLQNFCIFLGQAGYNQLVEKVITQKCSSNEDAVTEALVIENFLERSASQLTYHGLSELTTSMEEDEIGVLFRNNHFSTIYKVGVSP